MNAKEKKELALAKLILIVLAIVGLAVVVWVAWLKPSHEDSTINSYKSCAEAGNPILDSYPSVCITKDGKRFVNPAEKLK